MSRSSTTWPGRCSRWGCRARPRTSTRWSRSTAPSTGGWCELADHSALASALAAAVKTPLQTRNFHTYDEASMRRSLAHHVEIVDAVRAGDPTWAQAVMTAHIHNARAVMVQAASDTDQEET